jgi:diphthamide synthase subunit DPH2
VLELRDKLPHDLTAQLPEGAAEIQHIIANYLASKAGTLAMAGVPGWPACCLPMWAC